ncbi:MAG: RnfABCDGE type electron transport complex subunit A [Clostridia bacterium]|nr:RnfABCDGE type electron transport complex subunit A [Clostridia bacterium]
MEYFLIILGAVLVNNFVLNRFLGICPLLGVAKSTETAFCMGLAVIFVMSIASVVTYIIYFYVLVNLGLEYLTTVSFILVIASLVQIVEMIVKKFTPSLYNALGVYLPLITTNCAVMGVALLNIDTGAEIVIDNVLKAFINGFASGAGFMIAIVLLAGIREKLERARIPAPFKGFPITLITASIMAMAFAAFGGII